MERTASFYSALINAFPTICLAIGIGIATGMIAGTTGLEGSARGRMTLLAVVMGLVLGYIGASVRDGAEVLGAAFAAIAAGFSCAVISGVIAGATRRGGTAALGFIAVVAALLIAVAAILFPYFALIPAAALVWLAIARRKRADRKHAGLRVLR